MTEILSSEVLPPEPGWMGRCVLIASPRQAEAWRASLLDAATKTQRELVFLDAPVRRSECACGSGAIFVSTDRRHFAPTVDCKRAVLLHGVDHFAGLDNIDPEHARIHIIEMSRYAVEALDWEAGTGTRHDGAGVCLFGEVDVTPPVLSCDASGGWNKIASQCLRFATSEEPADWPPELFLLAGLKEASPDRPGWHDLTGPPRTLLRGPYLWSRPGRWRVKAQFAVDEDGSKHELNFTWGPVLSTNHFAVTPGAPGVFEVELDAEWSSIDGMEFAIALNHSAMGGAISFLTASVGAA